MMPFGYRFLFKNDSTGMGNGIQDIARARLIEPHTKPGQTSSPYGHWPNTITACFE